VSELTARPIVIALGQAFRVGNVMGLIDQGETPIEPKVGLAHGSAATVRVPTKSGTTWANLNEATQTLNIYGSRLVDAHSYYEHNEYHYEIRQSALALNMFLILMF
jgi:hypothetical protein